MWRYRHATVRAMDNWISIRDRLPTKANADRAGWVFVWHEYQGVMLAPWDQCAHNPFHTHWMAPADHIIRDGQTQWTDARIRPPTKADADVQACVLVIDRYNEINITGWHQFSPGTRYTHWMQLPGAP